MIETFTIEKIRNCEVEPDTFISIESYDELHEKLETAKKALEKAKTMSVNQDYRSVWIFMDDALKEIGEE